MITIYHNGRCSKSRGALEILQEKGIPHEVRWYLTDPLTQKELRVLLKKLGMKPEEIVRKSEPFYKETLQGKKLDSRQWLSLLTKHPVLIERPIVEKGDMAIVARPPELVESLLD